MATPHRLTLGGRQLHHVVCARLRVGLAPRHPSHVTVTGRRSGRLSSTPVALVEEGDQRWLGAPAAEVSWVRNARAAGQVTLSRR
jgi:hypothetical protein